MNKETKLLIASLVIILAVMVLEPLYKHIETLNTKTKMKIQQPPTLSWSLEPHVSVVMKDGDYQLVRMHSMLWLGGNDKIITNGK